MRELILTTAALLMLAASAHATDWDIPDGQGGYVDNPECTGGCADLRDQGRNQKPDRPKGDRPGRVEGEKPQEQRQARSPERPSDAKRTTRGNYCIAPTGQIAAVDGATGPIPAAPPKCGPWVHIKGGVVGQW